MASQSPLSDFVFCSSPCHCIPMSTLQFLSCCFFRMNGIIVLFTHYYFFIHLSYFSIQRYRRTLEVSFCAKLTLLLYEKWYSNERCYFWTLLEFHRVAKILELIGGDNWLLMYAKVTAGASVLSLINCS